MHWKYKKTSVQYDCPNTPQTLCADTKDNKIRPVSLTENPLVRVQVTNEVPYKVLRPNVLLVKKATASA